MKLSIVYPNPQLISQTFIRAHIERLPAEVSTWTLIPKHNQSLAAAFSRPKKPGDMWLRLEYLIDSAKRAGLALHLLKNRPHAVLAEYGHTGVALMNYCAKKGLPLVVHFHGADVSMYEMIEKYGADYPRLFKVARAVIAVSKDMEKRLIELGAPPQKVHYLPCGADTSIFYREDSGVKRTAFLSVGNFVDKKAPHLTIMAFSWALEQCPDLKLTMMGGGPLWEACSMMVKALGIEGSVKLSGPASHHQVAEAMRSASVFLQHSHVTSYGDSEGTPVAIMEAGASGIPVIATRHGGIKDVVIHGETGYLVEEGDIRAMADYIVRLAEHPDEAARMGKAARKRIEENFSLQQSIDRLWKIIESAAGA